jgi:hypothetical protein
MVLLGQLREDRLGNLRSTPLHRQNAEIGVTLNRLFQDVKTVFYNFLVLVKLEFLRRIIMTRIVSD